MAIPHPVISAFDANLVDLEEVIATVSPKPALDIRYATTNNFLNRRVYSVAKCFLMPHVAKSLIQAHLELTQEGFGLLIFDGYRPWSVTKIFWESVGSFERQFLADPKTGSVHNRGCAVDLSMVDLTTGLEVEMPSLFDEMTERSYIDYEGGTENQRRNRSLLSSAMLNNDFTPIKTEWWHYNHRHNQFPVLDIPLESL